MMGIVTDVVWSGGGVGLGRIMWGCGVGSGLGRYCYQSLIVTGSTIRRIDIEIVIVVGLYRLTSFENEMSSNIWTEGG